MKLTFNLLSVLLAALLLVSCQDDPSSLGASLIPDEDKVEIDSLGNSNFNFQFALETFKDDSVDIGGANSLLLGNYDNISSSILIQYYIFLPDSISDALDNNGDGLNLLDAWIELDRRYEIGDVSSTFYLSAHKIKAPWVPNDFTEEDLDALLPDIETSVNLTNDYTIDDSLLSIRIDKSVAYDWIKNSLDTALAKNYGIYLKPDEATNKILGFYGLSSTNVTNISRLKLVVEKQGEFIDTLTATVSGDVHVNRATMPVPVEGEHIIQGGIPMRGRLSFNLENLPGGIIINNARLTLKFDESQSNLGEPESSIIYAQILADTTGYGAETDYGVIQLIKDVNTFQGDITTFAQYWQNGELKNLGLKFYIANDIGHVSKISFYGPEYPDATLVPELVITYTSQR